MWLILGSLMTLAIFVFLYYGVRAMVQEWLYLERKNEQNGVE